MTDRSARTPPRVHHGYLRLGEHSRLRARCLVLPQGEQHATCVECSDLHLVDRHPGEWR